MKLQRQIAKNRVALALPIALLMAANAWSAKQDTDYIDENGNPAKKECTLIDADYLAQATHATVVNTGTACIVVNDTLEYSGHFSLTASDVTFIIADEAKFTINFNSQSDDNHPIGVGSKTRSGNIKFFGQKNQTGSLILNNTGTQYGRGLSAYGDIQIYGGHITVTSSGKDAIWANNNIDIYGGYISASTSAANYDGIEAENGSINVNWANSLYASSYSTPTVGKSLNIVNGLTLKGSDNNTYSSNKTPAGGITLTPTDYLVQIVTNEDNSKRAIINGEYSGEAVNIPSETVVAIDYNRTFTASVPATVVLPFSLPEGATTNAKFYRLTDVVKKDGACAWEATAQNIATDPNVVNKLPQANEPYIVMLNSGDKLEFDLSSSSVTFNQSENPTTTVSGGNWSFIGVYSFKEWKSGDEELGLAYGFAGSNEDNIAQGEFGKIAIAADAAATGYPSANPFRAYLRKKDNTVKLQCPQAVLGQNSAQYSLGHNSETIDVHFIDEDENGEKTTFMARMNTRTGEFTMLRNFDIKGRKVNAANKVRGAYYGKKVIKQ